MSTPKMKLLVNYHDLPEKIQRHLSRESITGFVAALKTSHKPNATIPILWLIIHNDGIIFCSTHKTRGIFKSLSYGDIDSIKINKGQQFISSKIEIIMSGLKEENIVISMPSDTDFEHLQTILETMNYQII